MITFTNGVLNLPIWIVITVLILPSAVSLITIALTFTSTIIQNRQKSKIEKFQTICMQKLKLVQDFTTAYGNVTKDTIGDFAACTYAVMIIADEETQKELLLLLGNIVNSEHNDMVVNFPRMSKCITALGKSIE